jgi:L-ascorbate metabolism protein UlaG (beta-lactamase superfamily)
VKTTSQLLHGFTWYKQSSFRWRTAERTVYLDPWGLRGDLPIADLVLVTHMHFDHFSKDGPFAEPDIAHRLEGEGDLRLIRGPKTVFVAPRDVAKELSGQVRPMRPGDRIEVAGFKIEAVPAYNIREESQTHPKEREWLGYVVEHRGTAIYHAGDTDRLRELERLRVDVALVPIGDGRATMNVTDAAALVRAMRPKVAVPMHFGAFPGGVTGGRSDGERFRREAEPVNVHVFEPVHPFLTD